jgi:phosphomethylpyrimidine synthase
MTQLEFARKKKVTPEMRKAAVLEKVDPDALREKIAQGKAVLPVNPAHKITRYCAIGEGLRTKVNANLGTSAEKVDLRLELKKLKVAIDSGSDTVMDLSTGGNLKKVLDAILSASTVPVGTVPIYQVVVETVKTKKHIRYMTEDDIFGVIEDQAKKGVDFQTVHSGVTLETVERLKKEGRIMDVVSRGGAFLIEWMVYNKKENPLYANFKRLIEIARKYDVTLSLGDGMRPGSISDATDRTQVQELILLGELCKQAQEQGVQVMIEGPGHVPLNQIETNVILQKKLCHGAPFYVLGPLVTDVAPGYDHIVGAIGGAIAAMSGADFLCYVTPSEHLALPTPEDVKEGVIASRIAAHAADIAKGVKGAMDWDIAMSRRRKARDWEGQFSLAIDSDKPRAYRKRSTPKDSDVCTMCGPYCSMKAVEKHMSST